MQIKHAHCAPERIGNPDFATAPACSKNRDALDAATNVLTEKKSTNQGSASRRRRRFMCYHLLDRPDVGGRASGASQEAQDVPNQEGRRITLFRPADDTSKTLSKMVLWLPDFGEQPNEVLAEFGCSAFH
jgi:crotonobetainyl-CoA:carnitine CoA-transferase CaiB-like acyl-CoA transferase